MYKKKCGITILIIVVLASESSARSRSTTHRGCTLKLTTDIPKSEPIYLSGNPGHYRLFKPYNETNTFAIGSKLTLFCAGKHNSLINSIGNSTELSCANGNRFVAENGTTTILSRINCTRGTEADIHITREKCSSDRGYIFHVGFRLSNHNFVSIFRVCYDNTTETTFFSTHLINGPVVKDFIKYSKRRNFKTTGMSGKTNVKKVYNKAHQIDRFNELLGSQQNFLTNSTFLSRGHLTPDADFVFPSYQLSTYFYVNVAPEFQSINGGNWIRIENMARALASDYNTEFLIYTGIHEVLSLPDRNRKLTPLYLDSANKIEVPKWFWKVLKNIQTDAAIAMITLNNPFATRSEIIEFCPNVCKNASLTSPHFENIKKGYTFCCEVHEFMRVVHDLPSNFTASSLLHCAHANRIFNDQK